MKKLYSIMFLTFAFCMLFSMNVFAGDSSDPLITKSNATEAVYDSELYKGLTIEPPYTGDTPLPSKYIHSSETLMTLISGTINTSTNVYYGPSSSYVRRETLSSGKSVTVIEREGSYYQIEYSTTGGLVRGYVTTTSVSGLSGTPPTANNDINKFGLNKSGSTATIYGGPNTSSYISIGSISKREIVTVLKAVGSGYHIEYYTSSGNKRGYIEQTKINVPSFYYNYSKPINSGSRTLDYGSGHDGIDIGVASGTSLYAIANGSANFKYAYSTANGINRTVSYGNWVELFVNGNKFIYAHMSSFINSYTVSPYPNANPPRGQDQYTIIVASAQNISVSGGQRIGNSGNAGNSTGAHLHFEVREGGSTIVDPFKYVLFPQMPK